MISVRYNRTRLFTGTIALGFSPAGPSLAHAFWCLFKAAYSRLKLTSYPAALLSAGRSSGLPPAPSSSSSCMHRPHHMLFLTVTAAVVATHALSWLRLRLKKLRFAEKVFALTKPFFALTNPFLH